MSNRIAPVSSPQTIEMRLLDGQVLSAKLHLLREVPAERGEYRRDEVSATLRIQVLGHARDGTTWIDVQPESLKTAWAPAPDAAYGSTEFARIANEELRKTVWRIGIDAQGHLVDLPKLPDTLSPDMRLLSEFILGGLAHAWLHNEPAPVSPKAATVRRTDWRHTGTSDTMTEERSELLGVLENGDLKVRQEVLERSRVIEHSRGYEERRRSERVGLYHPASGGWHQSIGSHVSETDEEETVRFELNLVTTQPGNNTGKYFEVQRNISDPCAADYVGPLSCKAEGAPSKLPPAADLSKTATVGENGAEASSEPAERDEDSTSEAEPETDAAAAQTPE